MDGRQRATVACVQRIEEDTGLRSANLPHVHSVGPVAERGFQQVSKSYLTLMRVELNLGGDDVLFSNIKFSNILKDQDTVLIGDKTSQDIEQGRFARTCCAGDEQIVAAANGVCENLSFGFRQHFPLDQIVKRKVS